MERGERCLQDAADRVQTSVVELGIRLGTSAGRISLNLLNPSASSGKTGAHFRFTRLNFGSWRMCVCVIALPFLPPVEPPVPGMFHPSQRCFQDAHPEQYKLFLMLTLFLRSNTHTLTHTHTHTYTYTCGWHYSVHTHTNACDKAKHYFCIWLSSSHKVWSQSASLQFVQRSFCVCER